jgi:hypothetical protein
MGMAMVVASSACWLSEVYSAIGVPRRWWLFARPGSTFPGRVAVAMPSFPEKRQADCARLQHRRSPMKSLG